MPRQTTIALAVGDPNGIGPELAVKAARDSGRGDVARVVLVGDRFVIDRYVASEAPGWNVREVGASLPPQADETIDVLAVGALPVSAFAPGRIDAAAGRATVQYVAAAVDAVKRGLARAIVACPHSETAVNAAGIRFSGYPSLLARCAGVAEDRVFLMLVGGGLRIVHATLHERLADALARLSVDLIEAAALAAASALTELGIATPRIGVFGINPHAGEGGLFGADDEEIGVPAVRRLREAGIAADGPLGADLLLGRRDLDAFVAMYHDQGHIPVKLLAGRGASALAVGAGLLFASVGHGSAFDVAGLGRADPAAILATLRLIAPGAATSQHALRETR